MQPRKPATEIAGTSRLAMLGESIGNYQVTGKLSEGGMGVVYRGEHALLGRPAAIKLLLPELSRDRDIVQRFFNEARVTSSIRHPGIVEIFDFGYHTDGRAYLIMELLGGESLAHRLARGRFGEYPAIVMLRSIAGALAAAHARGVVHRDLKPDNIFLVPDPDVPAGERPKLLDFGIAKLADARKTGATRTGMMLGTPAYMSPEQCRGAGEVDARTDLYALGCIVYECLAGRPPFVGEGQGELIGAHLHLEPRPLRELAPSVSPELDALVGRLLAKDPAHRPQTAVLLGDELAQIAAVGAARAGWPTPVPTPLPAMHGAAVPTTLGGAAGATPTRRPTTVGRGRKAALVVAVTTAFAAAGLVVAMQVRSHDRTTAVDPPRPAAAVPASVPSPPGPSLSPPPQPSLPKPPPPAETTETATTETATTGTATTETATTEASSTDSDTTHGKPRGKREHERRRRRREAPPEPPPSSTTTETKPPPLLITDLPDGDAKP